MENSGISVVETNKQQQNNSYILYGGLLELLEISLKLSPVNILQVRALKSNVMSLLYI